MLSGMTLTPLARLARWYATRDSRPRPCKYGNDAVSALRKVDQHRENSCPSLISNDESAERGHRGFCSPEHEALYQENYIY